MLLNVSIGQSLEPFSFFVYFNVVLFDLMQLLFVDLLLIVRVGHIQQILYYLVLGLACDKLGFELLLHGCRAEHLQFLNCYVIPIAIEVFLADLRLISVNKLS
jgi:hypothetical protein